MNLQFVEKSFAVGFRLRRGVRCSLCLQMGLGAAAQLNRVGKGVLAWKDLFFLSALGDMATTLMTCPARAFFRS
jgi:hypothetical protein